MINDRVFFACFLSLLPRKKRWRKYFESIRCSTRCRFLKHQQHLLKDSLGLGPETSSILCIYMEILDTSWRVLALCVKQGNCSEPFGPLNFLRAGMSTRMLMIMCQKEMFEGKNGILICVFLNIPAKVCSVCLIYQHRGFLIFVFTAIQ